MRSQFLQTAVLVTGFLAPLGSHAFPTEHSLARRGYQGVADLIVAVYDYLKDRNAYDSDVDDKCIVSMSTIDGGNCKVNVKCANDGMKEGTDLPDWNVCYVNGRQYLNHPSLGDFSVTFTKAGGVDGNKKDGLHDPVLQMANLNNWEPINVQEIVDKQANQDHGKLCTTFGAAGTGTMGYKCGLPIVGTAGFGMSNFPPADSGSGFTPGWCTMHVVQHQRNEFGVGANYEFDVIVKDNAKKEIGSVQLASIDGASHILSVSSALPNTIDITAAGGDSDPVVFKYGDQTWQSGDGSHQSTFATGPRKGFENGNREGDMGFNC